MSLSINKTSDFRTSFGKVCLEMVRKYKSIYPYYDDMMGCIIMSVEKYNSSEEIQDEIYSLLREKQFKDNDNQPNNWCMEVFEGFDPDTEKEEAEMLCVRAIESWQ